MARGPLSHLSHAHVHILHLREPLFQHGKGFLFFLPGVQRVDAVKGGFNGSGLPGEGNRLFEKPGAKRLIVSKKGKGFVVKEDDLIAQTKNGKIK